ADCSPSDWGAYASRVLVVASRDDELLHLEVRKGGTPSPIPEMGMVPNSRDSARRGLQPRTASATARMCSGVEPQQPPTKLSQPFSAHFATLGANVSAVSGNPVGDSASGRPAFGYALM